MARDSWLKRLIWLRGSPVGGGGTSYEKTVGPAPIISISDAKAKPAQSLIAHIAPVQEGSGDPSPDNIRPITGLTGLTVERTGSNLAKLTDTDASQNASMKDLASNSVTVYSDLTTPAYLYRRFALCEAAPFAGQTVTLSIKAAQIKGVSTPRVSGRLYESNGSTAIGSAIFELTGTSITRTFTLPAEIADGVILCLNLYCDSNSGGPSETAYTDIMLNLGSSADDFEPYVGQTYPVTWQTEAGTVYAGTVDVVTGEGTVTHGMVTVGDLAWTYSESANRFSATVSDARQKTIWSEHIGLSSEYVEANIGNNTGAAIGFAFFNTTLFVRDPAYTDSNAFKTAKSGVQFCYELAEPIPFTIPATQIDLLKGSNVLFSDADSLTLTYLGTTPANLLGGMLGGGLGGGYNPPAEQDPEELTEPEATETDEPAEEMPAEEGENNGE